MTRFFRLGLLPLAFAAATLRAEDAAAPAPAAPTPAPAAAPQVAPASEDAAALRADNKQLTDELATAWKESDKLKADLAAAQSTAAKSSSESADLKTQLDAQKAQATTPAAPPAGGDSNPQLAEVQDKLATALRSFSVIQNENSDLKTAMEKLKADNEALTQQGEAAKAQIATLQVQANATQQIVPLRNELRQSQDEVNDLARENERLRNSIAQMGPDPTSSVGPNSHQPTRPGSQALTPEPVAAAPTPTPTPAAKTYVIAEGDTLSRISRKFYGTANRWQDIVSANRDVIKNEKKLPVGDTIKIP